MRSGDYFFSRWKGRLIHSGIHILSHLRLLVRWVFYSPELAEPAVGAVHEGTNDGVGDGIEQAHAGDHHRSKQHAQGQHFAAEGRDVGKHQHIVHVGRAVVQRKQHQLVGFGAVHTRRRCFLFAHCGLSFCL